jgi:hypothetical protein
MDESMREKKQLNIEYALDDALDILRQGQNRLLLEPRKVRPAFLDTFLFSGRFNSVLGQSLLKNSVGPLLDLLS